MDTTQKRQQETAVVSRMISLYCRKKHGGKVLCTDCKALSAYAQDRIAHCPFMDTKTFCSNCKVHCYAPNMREKIREVMRFSGPRMLFYHPILATRHMIETQKETHRTEKKHEH